MHLFEFVHKVLQKADLLRYGLLRQSLQSATNALLQLHVFDLFQLRLFLQLVKLLVVLLEQVQQLLVVVLGQFDVLVPVSQCVFKLIGKEMS